MLVEIFSVSQNHNWAFNSVCLPNVDVPTTDSVEILVGTDSAADITEVTDILLFKTDNNQTTPIIFISV